MGLGGSSGSDGDGDVVEGIESKTGGDEGLAGQSWVLPCRRQYVPRRPRSALARRVPGPGAETLLEVIDFRTLADRPVGPKENSVPGRDQGGLFNRGGAQGAIYGTQIPTQI